MRKTLLVLSVAGVSLASQVGCEDQQPTVNQNMAEALQVLGTAGQGYVPTGVADLDTADLQAYRQQTLSEAVPKLEAVVRSGTPEQKVSALRLLADIDASASRHTVRAAVTEYAALAARSASLLSYLNAVERADERIRLFSQDRSGVIAALNELIAAEKARQQKLQGEADRLSKQIAALEAQHAQVRSQVDAAMGEAQQLGQQAFVADGEARYDLQEKQAEAQARANTLSAEAEQLEVQADVVRADLTIAQSQIAGIQETLATLTTQVQQGQSRAQQMTQERAGAESDRLEAIKLLSEEFSQVLNVYQQSVDQPLSQAGERAGQAVARQEQALNQATGAERQRVQADLLAARLDQVHALTEHVVVSAGLGRIAGVLAERAPKVMPQQAQPLSEAYQGIATAQDAVIAEATAAIEAGRTLANELTSGAAEGDATAARAASQAQRLQGYLGRISDSDLQ